MKIAVGADHRGVHAAKLVADRLRSAGNEVMILGSLSGESCDYPESAFLVGNTVAKGDAERGILICGTGLGMAMAANKVKGVRAVTAHDELTAEMSRSHNNANIMCLSADLLGQHLIEKIIGVFLSTPFDGGRHERRLRKIHAIEEGVDPSTIR